MLTIVIPNRNRNLDTVRRTLGSIAPQLDDQVEVVVIDYGSERDYQLQLKEMISQWKHMELISCPTQEQLWQKTRAINIVLKKCKTPFFMVADMDMLFHPAFTKKVRSQAKEGQATYFQVGVMTQKESLLVKPFADYEIKFLTDKKATGMTLLPTDLLKEIGGFDEFYHGWGSEDTDVHVRLHNKGVPVHFYEEEALLLHQWHPKFYRSKKSTAPFHDSLERINQVYLSLSRKHKRIQANKKHDWGVLPNSFKYQALSSPSAKVNCYCTKEALTALYFQMSEGLFSGVVEVKITEHPDAHTPKTKLKLALGKKTPLFIDLEVANRNLLEHIIAEHRLAPYRYRYDRQEKVIDLSIHLGTSV